MDTRTRGAVRGRSTHPRFPDYRKPNVGYIKRERLIPVDKPQPTAAPMSEPPQPGPLKTFANPLVPIEDAPKPLPTIPVYVDAPRPQVSPLQKNHAAGSFDMAPRYTHHKAISAQPTYDKALTVDQNPVQPVVRSGDATAPVVESLVSSETKASETPLQVPGFVFRMSASPEPPVALITASAFGQVSKILSPVTLLFDRIISRNVRSLMKVRKFTRVHALYGMAVAIFIGGVGVSLQGFLVNQQVVDQVHAVSQSNDKSDEQAPRDVPSEKPLPGDPTRGYHVAALAPRIMTIPKLGVNARVLSLGVSAENEMLTPKNIYDTGWYNGSAKPGEAGATVINGHVSGPTKRGVFHQIKTLVAGDELMIERGDGTKLSYHVKSVETLPESKVDMLKLLNAAVPGSSGLNLITCSGRYSSETNSYSDRTIVYAVLK